MASRSGPRAEGTDGSDYSHRESIANHYKSSADLKVKVRKSMVPHMLLTTMMFGKTIAIMLGSAYFVPLEKWEMVWVVSGISAFIGMSSLARNDTKRLTVYLLGNVFFGIGPLVYGFVELMKKVQVDFSDMKRVPDAWRNSPMKMALIAVCFTWQSIGVVYAYKLKNAWSTMAGSKKKS